MVAPSIAQRVARPLMCMISAVFDTSIKKRHMGILSRHTFFASAVASIAAAAPAALAAPAATCQIAEQLHALEKHVLSARGSSGYLS